MTCLITSVSKFAAVFVCASLSCLVPEATVQSPAGVPQDPGVQEVEVAPPPPQQEQAFTDARPSSHHVWVSGHWSWRSNSWSWVQGRWYLGRPGYVWEPGRWQEHHGRWRWVRGYWRAR